LVAVASFEFDRTSENADRNEKDCSGILTL
jgi:hypothetical protein